MINLTPTFCRACFRVALCMIILTPLTLTARTLSPEGPSPITSEAAFPLSENAPAAPADQPYKMQVALKTNLLFWLAGSPNVSVEIPVGDHFSVTASSAFTRVSIKKTYAIQTLQGGLDVKYWFAPNGGRTLTGWNAGAYIVSGAPWDVQWKTGWQGDSFLSAGLQGGYSLPVAKRWNLEFLLAAGWFHTPEARQYRKEGGHLMWLQSRGNVHRFSLTKAQVNLVWHFGRKER